MKNIFSQPIILLMGLFVMFGATVAQAEEMTSVSTASREYTLLAGYLPNQITIKAATVIRVT